MPGLLLLLLRSAGGRAADRDTWLGGVLTPRATEALARWIADGASGPLPAELAGRRFRHVPPRRRAQG